MSFRSFTFLILSGLVLMPPSSYSQELPQTLTSAAKIMFKTQEEPSEIEKRKAEVTKNLQRIVSNIQSQSAVWAQSLAGEVDLASKPKTQEFLDSLKKLDFKSDVSQIQKVVDHYKTYEDEITKTEWEKFKNDGSVSPEEYQKKILVELEKLKAEVEKYNQTDQIAVIDNFLTLEELDENQLDLIQNIDPQILDLSQNIQGILVDYYRSPNLKAMMNDLESRGEVTGKEELIEFTQILSIIQNTDDVCWANGSMSKVVPSKEFIQNLNGKDPKKETKEIGSYLLGINSDKDLASIKSYRFNNGENTYYLYQGHPSFMSEDTWVMAKVNPAGEMSFKYYRFNSVSHRNPLSSQGDLKVLESKIQNKSFAAGKENRLYFQTQQGIVVERHKENIPLIGEANLPKDRIMIGQVEMVYITPHTLTNNSLSVSNQSIAFETTTKPSSHLAWSTQAGVRFSPMTQRWNVHGNVQFMDLMLGYSDNLKGNGDGSLNYVFNNNFMGVSTNLNNDHQIMMGSDFGRRGSVSASTNFNNIHEVRVVLFLDRPRTKR